MAIICKVPQLKSIAKAPLLHALLAKESSRLCCQGNQCKVFHVRGFDDAQECEQLLAINHKEIMLLWVPCPKNHTISQARKIKRAEKGKVCCTGKHRDEESCAAIRACKNIHCNQN